MNRSSSISKENKKSSSDYYQSITKSAKRKSSQSQYITLYEAVSDQPQCYEGNKISLVQKFINEIDLLPTKYHKIETLYLSSNNIKSLAGLEQFSCLKNLSLANNNVDDSASLNVLQELPTIEVLTLNGNPICRLPNYRSLVISMLPCLKSLDGKPVNIDEKHRSEINLKTQGSLLDLLLRNYCELIKLGSLNQKLELHKELLSKHQRFARNYAPMDVPKWKKAFDLETQLDPRSKDILKANLLKDVDTIKQELELKDNDNETAFTELILRQQQKISELIVRAEETVKNVNIFNNKLSPTKFTDFQPQVKESSTPLNLKNSQPVSALTLSTKTKSSKALTSELNSASLFDYEPKSLKSILKSSIKSPEANERGLSQKLSKTQYGSASTADLVLPASRTQTPLTRNRGKDSITFPVSAKNTTTQFTGEWNKSSSPHSSPFRYRGGSPLVEPQGHSHKEECCRSLHKQINQMGQEQLDNVWTSLVDANKSTSFKKRLEEKVRLIENLTRDLRLKNQELIKYESINHQLAERLSTIQNQNRENVKVAQYEIDKLTRELETSLEAQRVLEEGVESIKLELEDLYQKNIDLEHQNKRLTDIEAKANALSIQLEERILEETLTEKATLYRNKKLKVKGFRMFKQGIRSSKASNAILEYNRIKKAKKMLCLSFSSWKRTTIINGYIREKNEEKNMKLQAGVFGEWLDLTVNWKKVRGFIAETNERKMKKSIVAWKQFLDITSKKQLANKKALQHFIKKTKKRALKRFVDIRKRAQYDSREEKAAFKKAQAHKILYTRKTLFAGWKNWTKTKAKPLRLKHEKSDALRRVNLLKFGMKVWTSYKKTNEKVLAKAQRKIARKNQDLTAKCLKLWKYYLNTVIPQKNEQELKKEMFIKKRLMKIWVDQLQAKKKVNASVDKAIELYNKTLTQRVFKHLAKLRLKRKQLHFFKNVIQTKRLHAQTTQCFSKWSTLFKKIQVSKKEEAELRTDSLSTFFQAWKKVHQESLAEKDKQIKIENHLIKMETNQVSNILQGWARVTRQRRRNREVIELLASRKKATLYKTVMFELVKNARQSLKVKMNKIVAKSSLLEAHVRDNVDYVRDLDEERTEMQDRTNQYKHELTQASLQLEDKNREINNLKRVLQQYEKNEKNLFEELTFKSSLAKDLEVKVHRNSSEKLYINGEYEKEVEGLKSEKVALLKKIVALEEELDCNKQSLKDAEKALVDKSNQAQNLVQEAERKAAKSVKVAGELRNETELKEEEVSSLLARLQMANEEKQEFQSKLAEALNATKDTKEFYEGRIRLLERQNAEMLSNMEYFKEDMSKQQKLISDLKSDLRTSHHKLEVVKNRAQQSDEELVKELRRGVSRSPRFADHVEAQSPCKAKISVIDTFRREYIADNEEYRTKKNDIDRKLAGLEVYTQENRVNSPPSRLVSSQGNNLGLSLDVKNFASSMRSKRTDSTTDSNLEVSTKDMLSPLGLLKTNCFTPSAGSARASLNAHALSAKNANRRDRSPILTVSALGNEYNFKASLSGVNDQQLDRQRRERQDKREGLERRMEVITQSLQADLHKARNRVLNGF